MLGSGLGFVTSAAAGAPPSIFSAAGMAATAPGAFLERKSLYLQPRE